MRADRNFCPPTSKIRFFYNVKKECRYFYTLYMNSYFIYFYKFYFLFTKSFNALPALNTGAFDAGILISSLV